MDEEYLDIIFINSKKEIVDVYFNAKPFNLMTITSPKKAMFVLELNALVFKDLNLVIGDKIILGENKNN